MNLLVSRKRLLGNTGDFLWSYGGYLIVSALCDLCGVVLNTENARNFIAECIENLHNTLKANLSVNGANYSLSLNDELVSEFIDFYLSVGGKQYLYNEGDECIDITGGFNYISTESNNCIKDEGQIIFDGVGSSSKDTFSYMKSNKLIENIYKNIAIRIKNEYWSDSGTAFFISFSKKENILLFSDYMEMNKVNIPKDDITKNEYKEIKKDITTLDKDGYLFISLYLSGSSDYTVKNYISSVCLEKEYDIGNSYVKSLEEYKAKYENEPSRVILDSSIVKLKTKWRKKDTEIYIPNGNVESLPNGVNVLYGLWVYDTGDQIVGITGGWDNYHQDTHWFWAGSPCYKGDTAESYLSFAIKLEKSMCSLATNNKIDFGTIRKIKITYSRAVNTNARVAIQFVDNLQTEALTGAKLQVGDGSFATTENLDTYNTIEISYPEPKVLNEKLYVLVVLWGEVARYMETFRIKSIYIN